MIPLRPPVILTHVLYFSNYGPRSAEVQQKLASWGFRSEPDGVWTITSASLDKNFVANELGYKMKAQFRWVTK